MQQCMIQLVFEHISRSLSLLLLLTDPSLHRGLGSVDLLGQSPLLCQLDQQRMYLHAVDAISGRDTKLSFKSCQRSPSRYGYVFEENCQSKG